MRIMVYITIAIVTSYNRLTLLSLAMHAALDDSVANVTEALIQAGMINNTVIVFTSDNGGLTEMSPNWPLRYTQTFTQ